MSSVACSTQPGSPEAAALAQVLVCELGPHPVTLLKLDVAQEDEAALGSWLCAAILLTQRISESRALDAFRALEQHGLAQPATIAESSPTVLEEVLRSAKLRRPGAAAWLLDRASQSLTSDYAGALNKLAGESDSLEELGGRLSKLAAGFGRAGVAAFLAPLREHWPAAGDLPLAPDARAAAAHLGWVEGEEEVGAAILNRVLMSKAPGAQPLLPRDLEAALSRLGRNACLRQRSARCALAKRPHLAQYCPLHP